MTFPLHSGLFDTLRNFFPDTATIQQKPNPESQDAAGQPVEVWTNLPGHDAIPCRVMPSGGTERRSTNQLIAQSTHVILLTGAYKAIEARMRVTVKTLAYDILLPETDGSAAITRLYCEVINA